MSGILVNKRSHQIDIQVHTLKITTCFIVNELDFYFTHYDSHRANIFYYSAHFVIPSAARNLKATHSMPTLKISPVGRNDSTIRHIARIR